MSDSFINYDFSSLVECVNGADTLVCDPKHPILDTFARSREAFIGILYHCAGERGAGMVDELIRSPNEATIRTLTASQESVRNLCAIAVGLHARKRLAETRAQYRDMERAECGAIDFVIDRVLPSLCTIAESHDMPAAIRTMVSKLPASEAAYASRILEALESDDGQFVEEPGGPRGGPDFLLGMRESSDFFNAALFGDEPYAIQGIGGVAYIGSMPKNVSIPALLSFHDGNRFQLPDVGEEDAINYNFVSVIHPTVLAGTELAFVDARSRSAYIFRDLIGNLAEELSAVAKGTLPNPYKGESAPLLRHIARHYDENSLAGMIEWEALCEEAKHAINITRHAHSMGAEADSDIDIFERKRRLNDARLSEHGILRKLHREDLKPRSIDPGQRYVQPEVFINLEECNAKLFRLAVGPDPHFTLLHMLKSYTIAVECGGRSLGDHHALFKLLTTYAGLPNTSHDHAMKSIMALANKPTGELRLLAKNAFDNEYNERLEDSPFCTIDARGMLTRHSGTLEDFSWWA